MGYSGDPFPTPIRPPLPQTAGWQPPVKTCIATCGQTVPDTKVVCIDSIGPMGTYQVIPNGTIVDPSPKIKLELDGQGRAQREAARRCKSEWKVNLGIRNSTRSNGSW